MMKIKDVQTQQQLGMLMQKMQHEDRYSAHEVKLQVNDTAKAAKKINDRYQRTRFRDFYMLVMDDLTDSPLSTEKVSLIMDMVVEIFRDHTRFSWFSKSKKMMKRIHRNDKTKI